MNCGAEGTHAEAVPVVHKGQAGLARQRGAHKLLHDGRLQLGSIGRVAQQLLGRQQQVRRRVLGLRAATSSFRIYKLYPTSGPGNCVM